MTPSITNPQSPRSEDGGCRTLPHRPRSAAPVSNQPPKKIPCKECKGTGLDDKGNPCLECSGEGWVDSDDDPTGIWT